MSHSLEAIAKKHDVPVSVAQALLEGLQASGGKAVQFNHAELGGMGQWMPSMVMVGRMGDDALKAKVNALCHDLLGLLGSEPSATASTSSSPSRWWPETLGASPSFVGGQNAVRYAYFASGNRLVVDKNGTVTLYDTTGHALTGAGQQQSNDDGTMTFRTASGVVDLEQLPKG